jgi:hypothetical protein
VVVLNDPPARLADANEPVRDAALGAGRVFVEEFSHSGPSLDLLLPAIEDGITSENWRIRQSSVELLAGLLSPQLPITC